MILSKNVMSMAKFITLNQRFFKKHQKHIMNFAVYVMCFMVWKALNIHYQPHFNDGGVRF